MKELLNKHNQRSCKMKKIKQTVPYNLKKVLAGIMLVAVPVFVSCEKDPVKPDNNNGNNQQPQKPKTYTYIYDNTGIPNDTVLAHMDVDTFYVIPTRPDLFAGVSQNGVHTIRNHLENHTLTNSKMHGKGDFIINEITPSDSSWLNNFGYNVKHR